jgi:hypothetical protein
MLMAEFWGDIAYSGDVNAEAIQDVARMEGCEVPLEVLL